jgi:hypothetical protein
MLGSRLRTGRSGGFPRVAFTPQLGRNAFVSTRPGGARPGRRCCPHLADDAYGEVKFGDVVISRGCAHGFEVLESPAITCYLQDGPFDPTIDTGTQQNNARSSGRRLSRSFLTAPVHFPRLNALESPCRLDGAAHVNS